MLVPSPAFRSMSLGIMLAVIFVLAATLTLLPAVLAKLGPRVDRLALRGRTPASTAPRGSPPGASGSGGARCAYGADRVLALLVALAIPVLAAADRRCRRSRSCRPATVLPHRLPAGRRRRSVPGAPGRCRSSRRPAAGRPRDRGRQGRPRHRAGHAAADRRGRLCADRRRCPKLDPSIAADRPDDRPAPRRAAVGLAGRRRGGREPRPPDAAERPRRRS